MIRINSNSFKEILDKYESRGLAVAAFPCNQFGGQVRISKKMKRNMYNGNL